MGLRADPRRRSGLLTAHLPLSHAADRQSAVRLFGKTVSPVASAGTSLSVPSRKPEAESGLAASSSSGGPRLPVAGWPWRPRRRRPAPQHRESCRRGSLLSMKSLHEPVVALAGLEQEWPGTGLALPSRNGSSEICRNKQKNANICQNKHIKYANIC